MDQTSQHSACTLLVRLCSSCKRTGSKTYSLIHSVQKSFFVAKYYYSRLILEKIQSNNDIFKNTSIAKFLLLFVSQVVNKTKIKYYFHLYTIAIKLFSGYFNFNISNLKIY